MFHLLFGGRPQRDMVVVVCRRRYIGLRQLNADWSKRPQKVKWPMRISHTRMGRRFFRKATRTAWTILQTLFGASVASRRSRSKQVPNVFTQLDVTDSSRVNKASGPDRADDTLKAFGLSPANR